VSESDASYITKSKLAKYMEKGAFKPGEFFDVFSKLFRQLDKEEE
jgi:hypothetical protein